MFETGVATLAFASVFLFGGRLYPLRALTRSKTSLISFSAGISLAYVFIHLMPELGGAREIFVRSTTLPVRFDGMVVYAAALLGFLVFFSLDHFTKQARVALTEGEIPDFDAKVLGFAGYVGLVAYLLVNNLDHSAVAKAAYGFAMAVHFLTFDHAFREQPGLAYRRRGHLVLAAAAPVGWGLGQLFVLPPDVLALMLGFLSGGVIVNSMISELRREERGRLIPLLAGAALYSAILIPLGP